MKRDIVIFLIDDVYSAPTPVSVRDPSHICVACYGVACESGNRAFQAVSVVGNVFSWSDDA